MSFIVQGVAIPADALLRLTGRFSADRGADGGADRAGKPQAASGKQEAVGEHLFPGMDNIPSENDPFPGHTGMTWGDVRDSYDWGGHFPEFMQGYIGMAGTPGFLQGPTQIQTSFDPQGYPYAVPVNPAFASGYGDPSTMPNLLHMGQDIKAKKGGGVIGYDDGGVMPDPQQMQQAMMMSPQQLQDTFMQQYGGYGGSIAGAGMKKGGVPKSYEILEQIAKQNPPKGDAVGIPARYRDGGVATDANGNPASYQPVRGGLTGLHAPAPDAKFQGGGVADDTPLHQKVLAALLGEEPAARIVAAGGATGDKKDERPETGTYSENPKVITDLERVAPYYYATPTAAPYRPSMEDYLTKLGMLPRGQTPENMSFQGGGVAYGNMMFDPTQLSFAQQQQRQQPQQQRPQQPSPVAGEPSGPQPKQPQRFEFGPADYWYEYPQIMQALMDQQAPPIEKGQGPPAVAAKDGGVIPKEFMQYLAKGGLVKKDFTPHDHLMFALGGMYALSPKQAAKRLKDTANPMPP